MKECKAFKGDKILLENVKIADRFFLRLIGLIGKKELDDGNALLLNKCKQVHTFGMSFTVDVIFLSEDGEILYIENNLKPMKISKYVKGAYWVLETNAGFSKKNNLEINNKIKFKMPLINKEE